MRNALLLFLASLLLACGGADKQKKGKQPETDTLPQARTDTHVIHEKADTAINPSLYAYAGAMFGMRMDEVLATEGFSGGTKSGETVWAPEHKRRVGNHNYDIVAHFHEDKLYLVTFGSAWQTAAFIEFDMVSWLNNLKDVIAIRYGQPQFRYKMPNVMDFEPGTHKWVYKWEIEDKVIQIGMREHSEGARYQAIMWIYNKPVFDRIGYMKSNVNKVKDAARF